MARDPRDPWPTTLWEPLGQVAQMSLCLFVLINSFRVMFACWFGGFIGGGRQAAFDCLMGGLFWQVQLRRSTGAVVTWVTAQFVSR